MNPLYIVLISLIVILGSLVIILARITWIRYKAMRIINNTRVNIARDLHDEIGATLSSISFYSEACKINIENQNHEAAMELVSQIGSSSRETIRSMSDIVWMINPKNDQLSRLFDRIGDFGKSILSSRGVTFLFYSDESLSQLVLPLEWRKNVYLIIREALNNIAKYAACTEAELLIVRKASMIEVVIKDNGKGFDTSTASEGNGILNMKVRASELGSKLSIHSTATKGTVITFNLPYPHNW